MPVKIDKVRIFLLGLADNEAAIVQVTQKPSPMSVLIVLFYFSVQVKSLVPGLKAFKSLLKLVVRKLKVKMGIL